MSEDMNDKSSKKTSGTSKSSTSKAEGSSSKAASSKTESTQSGTVETAAEQGSTSKGKSSSSSSSATASSASSTSSSSAASSSPDADQGSTQDSGEVFIGNSGLPRHFAAGLAYVLGPITGVIFLLLDRADPFVRFHAAQSLAISAVIAVIWIGLAILNAVFAGMPLIFWLGLIALLYMAFNAYQSKDWEVPVVGEYSQKLSDKVASETDAQ